MDYIVRNYGGGKVTQDPVEININKVKNVIDFHENPDPLMVLAVVVQIALILCIFYYIFIKRNITGVWYGKVGDYPNAMQYKICHVPLTDRIWVRFAGSDLVLDGYVAGNTVVINAGEKKIVGVLHKSQIIWANTSDIWNNVKLLN